MFKSKLITLVILASVFMQSCTNVLEPVFLAGENKSLENLQEEFVIKRKTLTFEKALQANKDYYSRSLMVHGSGSNANVYNEADFLNVRIPNELVDSEYRLGLGDTLQFIMLNEYKIDKFQTPNAIPESEYLIGIGDKLKFIRIADNEKQSTLLYKNGDLPDIEMVVETEGVVASNGSILLLGVGLIKANNRSLDELRIEVRNILIRNGQIPNFQLDIEEYNSKKVFVTNIGTETTTSVVKLNSIPVSLQNVAKYNGLSHLSGNNSLIVLTRKNKIFRYTATQLFSPQTPQIIIQDADNITFKMLLPIVNQEVEIGEAGKILLEGIGYISAENRTLKELQEDLKNVLADKDLNSEFLLDIINFQNKKAYFSNKDLGSSVVDLTNKKISLKELLYKKQTTNDKKGIQIVTLTRDKQIYRLPLSKILDPFTPDIWIQGNDQIEVKFFEYKPGQVFTLSASGQALIIPIDPSNRETLANVLFKGGGAFNNLNSKRSEVYLLRGQEPVVAYHLDAQNVSRILVAAQMELRPNDIIYVAERDIISFTRLLQEITPLRVLLRDLKDNNIP